ncbi:glutathione s-transferase n-terminal domain [Holotrichia oblita]|uniref:Glutathione s-transferase n-terminal domain n=1 Tax=Holotrichia oblita TaxID=644536 RepID=A0ACB9TV83_HOLOL|nr:glutathione s-transferase n-terminal domain [Holotrichia oblita]
MSINCNICSRDLNPDNEISCDLCRGFVHTTCSDLSRIEIQCLKAKIRKLTYYCVSCSDFKQQLKKVHELTSLVCTLQNELRELKEQRNNNDCSKVDKDIPDVFMMEKIVQEVAEREKRRNNLIIFNVPELEGGSKADQVAADVALVTDILQVADISLARATPTRLGSEQPPKIENKLRLYSMEYCPYAHRVRLVLRTKNLDYDIVNINLINKPEWYANVHPEGKVPALDTEYPNPPLYPPQPLAIEKDKDVIQKIDPLVNTFNNIILGKEKKSLEEWKNELVPHLKIFDQELEKRGKKYFGGQNPGMVDYMLWPWAERAGTIAIVLGERLPFKSDELTNLRQWRKVMREHTVVEGIYNGPEKFYKSVLIKLGSLAPDYDAI